MNQAMMILTRKTKTFKQQTKMETLTAVEISKVDLSKLEDGIYLTNLGNRLLSTSPINGRRLYQGEEPLGVITHLYLPTPLVLDEERVINLITKIVYQNSTDDSTSIRITFEKVDYIIGSGQHTNSHIYNTNGYLHQMPMTYYTQKQKWDFPPGFGEEPEPLALVRNGQSF